MAQTPTTPQGSMTDCVALSPKENSCSTLAKHFNYPRKILFIDDEISARLIVQYCLEDINQWHVITVSQDETLYQAKRIAWDAILLEIASFEGVRFTVFEQLLADAMTRSIPILLLTSKVTTYDLVPFQRLPIAGIISKPFDPVALGSQIANILGWTEAENIRSDN